MAGGVLCGLTTSLAFIVDMLYACTSRLVTPMSIPLVRLHTTATAWLQGDDRVTLLFEKGRYRKGGMPKRTVSGARLVKPEAVVFRLQLPCRTF